MSKVRLYIAASLDGYIADHQHGLDWLETVEGTEPGNDHGFAAFYQSISVVVMGRKTYDIVCGLVGKYPHDDKISYIFSRRGHESTPEPVTFINGDVAGAVNRIRDETSGDIWLVGGGELCRQFLDADLIDHYILTIAPIHLGRGVPLWPLSERPAERHWRLLDARPSGPFAQLIYERKR